ncbi:hypothetical protein QA634_09390 [Methylobacterium sp. CB376]|uniref:hypothetical protein n=1 Tax=unclassified Methylobacterium TaxID=2615210 RepID=UPI00123783D3|nr:MULTISPECIES: hypothetical protein [Methylobacterium]WFT82047.1 hypothetical protein QA634_09390 [Methylobacterium nodulans]
MKQSRSCPNGRTPIRADPRQPRYSRFAPPTVKIAAIVPEAKQAAVVARLNNNQSKLLQIARTPPERGVSQAFNGQKILLRTGH